MDKRDAPIGIFDSGMGGLSVLRTARALLPHEQFLYYGDTAYAPYGTKTPQFVLERARQVTALLRGESVKAIVIACNTATGVAAQTLRAENALPIIAMEPALKPASLMRHGGNVLVLATPVTLSQEKFAHLMERYGEGAIPLPCPGLMDFVERLELSGERLNAYFSELFAPYRDRQIDAVVLGCTHYSFLKRAIGAHFPPDTHILDGNEGTVRQLARRLDELGQLRTQGEGGVQLRTSSTDASVIDKMKQLLAM